MNKTILLGNITRDIDVKVTTGGLTIALFSIAVNRKWKDKQGQQQEEVSFVEISAFGKQAEIVAQYFQKGSKILVEGRLKQDQWEDQQGQKRSKLGVILEGFDFVNGKAEHDPVKANQETIAGSRSTQYNQSNIPKKTVFDDGDEPPF